MEKSYQLCGLFDAKTPPLTLLWLSIHDVEIPLSSAATYT